MLQLAAIVLVGISAALSGFIITDSIAPQRTPAETAVAAVASVDLPEPTTVTNLPVFDPVVFEAVPGAGFPTAAPVQQPVAVIPSPVADTSLVQALAATVTTLAAQFGALEKLEGRLSGLEARPVSSLSPAVSGGGAAAPVYVNTHGLTQKIDRLENTTITNATISGGSVTAASILGTIANVIDSAVASIDSLTADTLVATNAAFTNSTTTNATTTNHYISNLMAAAANVTGDLTVSGTITGGTLSVSGLSSGGAVEAPYFTATSTTATSSFAGGFTAGTNGLTVLQNGNVGIGTTAPNSHLTLANADPWADIRVFEGAISSGHEIGVGGRQIIHRYANGNYRLQLGDNAHNGGSGNDGIAFGYTGNSIAAHGVALGAVASKGLGLFTSNGTALTERMRIDGSGNVGIGTTGPGNTLDIRNAAATSQLRLGSSVTENYFDLGRVNATGAFQIQGNQIGANNITLAPTSGNVGIGETSPADPLHIKNSVPDIRLEDSEGGYSLVTGSGGHLTLSADNGNAAGGTRIDFEIDGSNVARIINGNVGIGTTSPYRPLSVSGSGVFSGGDVLASTVTATSTVSGAGFNATTLATGYQLNGNSVLSYSGGVVRLDDLGGGFALRTGSTNRLFADTSGNIGVGNSSPTFKLDVTGTARFTSLVDAAHFIATSTTATSTFAGGLTAGTNGLTVLQNGNVGIGTTAPDSKLVITDANSSVLKLNVTNDPGNYYTQFVNNYDSAEPFYIMTGAGAGEKIFGQKVLGNGNRNSYLSGFYGLALATGAVNPVDANVRMLITQAGNVGIGTTSPNNKLTVNGSSDISYLLRVGGNVGGGGFAGDIVSRRSATTGVYYFGESASNYLYFDGTNYQFGSGGLYVNTSGNVGIGTTTPSHTLSVAGTVGFDGLTGATGAGSLCLDASKQVVYNAGSDACLPSLRDTKHDILALSLSGIDTIEKLEPVSFVYNEGDGRVRLGFIAENTAAVHSELATYNAAGAISGIDDRAVLSVVVKAIKEMWAHVTGQDQRITTHDTEIAALNVRIANLEVQLGAASAAVPTASTATIELLINGNNPALIAAGESYVDLGATASSSDTTLLALGIRTFVDGTAVETVVVDTSIAATTTITYRIIDGDGAVLAEAERTVVVSDPAQSELPAEQTTDEPIEPMSNN